MTIFRATQRCNIVSNSYNIVPTLQCCIEQKLAVANRPVQYHRKATITRHWTDFRPAKKFDRTLGSHGTVQYFFSDHTELRTSKHLNVRTVKVGPCERNTLTREVSTVREFVRCHVNVA